MSLLERIRDHIRDRDASQLAASIANQLADQLRDQIGNQRVIIIGRIDISVNIANGGGASIRVQSPGAN